MKTLSFFFFILLLTSNCQNKSPQRNYTLIKGGTLLDLTQLGNSYEDIEPAFILINGTKIEQFGKLSGKERPLQL